MEHSIYDGYEFEPLSIQRLCFSLRGLEGESSVMENVSDRTIHLVMFIRSGSYTL